MNDFGGYDVANGLRHKKMLGVWVYCRHFITIDLRPSLSLVY